MIPLSVDVYESAPRNAPLRLSIRLRHILIQLLIGKDRLQPGHAETTVDDRDGDPVVANEWASVFDEIVGDVSPVVGDPVSGEVPFAVRDFGEWRLAVLDGVVVAVRSLRTARRA